VGLLGQVVTVDTHVEVIVFGGEETVQVDVIFSVQVVVTGIVLVQVVVTGMVVVLNSVQVVVVGLYSVVVQVVVGPGTGFSLVTVLVQ